MPSKNLIHWEKLVVNGICLGLLMIGWTGFRTQYIYFVIGLISTLSFFFHIVKKPKTPGIRCLGICISIVISSTIPILFFQRNLFVLDSANVTGLGDLFDLTQYLPFSNMNELILFNLNSAGKWLLAIIVFRTLCKNFCSNNNKIRLKFIRFWLLGVLLSVTAQFLQLLNFFPRVSFLNSEYSVFNGRFPGLSDHPNTIAIIVCMSLPLVYLSNFSPVVQTAILTMFIISELLAQSRIGIVTFALIFILCQSRVIQDKTKYFFITLFCAIMIVLLYKLGMFYSILDSSRFGASNMDSQRSNEGRWILMKFGIQSFLDNPIFGVGPRAFKESHNIFIQVLSGLGIFGFIGFMDFLVRPFFLKYNSGDETFFPKLCILSFFVFGLFNNKLTDFYLYFPLILSLQFLADRKSN